MGEKEPKNVENEAIPAEEQVAQKDVAEEKSVTVIPLSDHKSSLSVPEKISDAASEKSAGGSIDRDAVLARVETEKRLALIKAWEESEKTRAENKAFKKLSAIDSWENRKKASVEAQLRKIEEKLEKKKAEYGEQMKNKMVEVHKAAEEKRAVVEASRGEQFLKVEETAAKYRAAGFAPKKLFGCFSS
uniref:Remorin 2 n=1 Tax=Datisca glomerata TaxID=34297 RepID=T1R3E6_DATGL|nr:remorin 2 [Datisca glomerata]